MTEDDLLGRKQAAAYLTGLGVSIAPKTLGNLASNQNAGKGPPFLRIRWRQVKYRRAELAAWAKAQIKKVD